MVCKSCGHGRVTPSGAVNAAKIQTPETTEVRSWTSLPLLDITNVPEDLDLIGGSNKEYQSWRVPASYFLGGALNTTKYEVSGEVELQPNQVMPVYFSNQFSSPVKAIAGEGTLAQALAVTSENGSTTVMVSGFYKFSRPHLYEVGKTYYTSATNAGEVVSVKPAAYGQALFTVVDQLTIAINVESAGNSNGANTKVLYNNLPGSTDDITLSDSVENYDYVTIYFRGGSIMSSSVKVVIKDNTTPRVPLTIENAVGDDSALDLDIYTREVLVSGNTISTHEGNYGTFFISSDGTIDARYTNPIRITRVEGTKISGAQ